MLFWIFIASLLVGKVVISVAAALPTDWWNGSLGWINRHWRNHRERRLQAALARAARETRLAGGFSAAKSFLPQGIGLALDPAHRMLFLAEQSGRALVSAILPYAAVQLVRRGEANIGGFFDHYVEISVRDQKKPSWRLLCGDDPQVADEVERTLKTSVLKTSVLKTSLG